MFTNANGLNLPVLASEHATHADLSMGREWIPTSAGTFDVTNLTCKGESTSLGLKPRAGDAQIIQTVLAGFEASICLTQDLEQNLLRRDEQIKRMRR